jgi:broad-specificity NMP kinase
MPAGPDVIIIRGAPGVGKSSAASLLAQLYPSGAKVEVDRIRSMVNSVDWTDQPQHIAALQVAVDVACRFLEQHVRPVIIVDTFSGDKVRAFVSQMVSARPSIQWSVFTFHADARVLEARLKGRDVDDFKDLTIAAMINRDVLLYQCPGEVMVDTSCLDAAGVVARIREHLASA